MRPRSPPPLSGAQGPLARHSILRALDAREEIEALVAFEGRAPGTDAERRAAGHLQRRLEQLGREAELENVDCWPRWPLSWGVSLSVAVFGSVVAVSSPLVGLALVLAAGLLLFIEAAQIAPLGRRLLGRRASQNVVSREDGGKPGTLVLVAHVDSGRGGLAFARRLQTWRAVPLWALVVVLACGVARVAGLEGSALTAVQFVPTVVLIACVPLLVDISLSEVSPGANDNASGVAAALALAERHGDRLEHFDLWLLLTGAQESLADGMRGFLRRHRAGIDRRRTVFVNLDEVGLGSVRYTQREGVLIASRSHVQLLQLCAEIAEDDSGGRAFGARPLVNRVAGDAAAARAAGFPALTISCRNARDHVPHHHSQDDTPERIEAGALARATAFCSELIDRLDAELGPELSRPEQPASQPAG